MLNTEALLPEDLKQKIEGSTVSDRREVFRGVREELYKRAFEFGEGLYDSFLENPDIDYINALQAVSGETKLSERQRRLYSDIVRLAYEDFRHVSIARELLEKKKSTLGKEALEQGLVSEEASNNEVLGIIIYYGITGLWPKGKVILVDDNKLAVEIIVMDRVDRAGIYNPKDIQESEKEGEGMVAVKDPFGGLFRKDATAFGLRFPLVVVSGEGKYKQLVEKHERRHHVNEIVTEALSMMPVYAEPLSKRLNDTYERLREIEGVLSKGEVDMDQAKVQYEEALRGFMPTAFDYAKDELLAGYAETGDILKQVGDMLEDKTQNPNAYYDYFDYLYRHSDSSKYFFEKLPQELKDVLANVKTEYTERMAHQAEEALSAFYMIRDFGSEDDELALEGLLQTTPLLRWESEIKKVYGSKIEAYKEFRGFEKRICSNNYFNRLSREEPSEENEAALEQQYSIISRFGSLEARMKREMKHGSNLESAMAKERSRFESLEEDANKLIREASS